MSEKLPNRHKCVIYRCAYVQLIKNIFLAIHEEQKKETLSLIKKVSFFLNYNTYRATDSKEAVVN